MGGALVGFYILLPLDRGFPSVPVFGRPLNSAVAATLAVLCALIIRSRGRILGHLSEPYCVAQSAYCGVLVLSSFRTASPLSALQLSVVYYCTFVLNYVILRHITRENETHKLIALVATVGAIAAAVGVVQAVLGVRLPIYETWFRDRFLVEAEDYTLGGVRSVGTLNNPILYGTAMALLLPYVLELRRAWLRMLVVPLLLLACALSGSRTTVLVLMVFVVGAAVVHRWRVRWAVPPLCVGLLLLVQLLGGWSAAGDDPRIVYLLERFGVREGSAATTAELSIAYRQEALLEGIREMANEWGSVKWLVGRGQFTSASVGEKVVAGYNTVDNVFFGVLYEQGLIGLTLFLAGFTALLLRTSCVKGVTLHWYGALGLFAAGVSFNWDAYSTFNILAVGSMAIATTHAEDRRCGRRRDQSPSLSSRKMALPAP